MPGSEGWRGIDWPPENRKDGLKVKGTYHQDAKYAKENLEDQKH